MTEETVCIGLARVSSETQKIVSGTLKELKDIGKLINLFQILTNYSTVQFLVQKRFWKRSLSHVRNTSQMHRWSCLISNLVRLLWSKSAHYSNLKVDQNCSNVHCWSKFDVRLWTKSEFVMHFQHMIIISFKHFPDQKLDFRVLLKITTQK